MELGVCLPDICTKNDVAIEAMEYTRMMFYDESQVEFSMNQTQIEGTLFISVKFPIGASQRDVSVVTSPH